jgi:hypothetical protein
VYHLPKHKTALPIPESRIMKRAGGGFDYSYNAQTAVDESAHIIVAAEVVNTSSDVQQLPMVLNAVKAHTGEHRRPGAGRCGLPQRRSDGATGKNPTRYELVIALGREGKVLAKPTGCTALPAHGGHGGQVPDQSKARRTTESANGSPKPPNGWIKNVAGDFASSACVD